MRAKFLLPILEFARVEEKKKYECLAMAKILDGIPLALIKYPMF